MLHFGDAMQKPTTEEKEKKIRIHLGRQSGK
jgi:hypothetical protein